MVELTMYAWLLPQLVDDQPRELHPADCCTVCRLSDTCVRWQWTTQVREWGWGLWEATWQAGSEQRAG